MKNSRIKSLEELVSRYEKSLADFHVINDELRTLPASDRLTEILELNGNSMSSTARLLECARERLQRELSAETATPFANTQPQTA